MAKRTLDITQCPDRFLKHNLEHGFFDMLASITQVQSYYSLYSFLDETDEAQNNTGFVFARQTSNDNRQRSNLRTAVNQVTNLKSLDFTWKKIANLLGVSTSFWSSYFCNGPFCDGRCCKTSICISCCREADDSPAPTLWSSLLLSPLSPPLVLGNSFSNSCYGCWFSSISPFAMFTKSINDFTISFKAFSLFMI